MKANYHTHTTRCKHASGSDEDYVISAIKGGYKKLGFSDHAPWKYDSNYIGRIRMGVGQFDEYYNSIKSLKEKYKQDIHILIGLEVEYFPKYMNWMKDLIKQYDLDYIILGNHFDGSDEEGVYFGSGCENDQALTTYIDTSIEALQTGLYSYLAHPDLFMRGRRRFDKLARDLSYKLCEACKEMNIPLEYNLAGAEANDYHHITQYPHPEFWKIAASVGNTAIIGVDAHNNFALEQNYYYNEAVKTLKELGINRIDELPLVNFDEIL